MSRVFLEYLKWFEDKERELVNVDVVVTEGFGCVTCTDLVTEF